MSATVHHWALSPILGTNLCQSAVQVRRKGVRLPGVWLQLCGQSPAPRVRFNELAITVRDTCTSKMASQVLNWGYLRERLRWAAAQDYTFEPTGSGIRNQPQEVERCDPVCRKALYDLALRQRLSNYTNWLSDRLQLQCVSPMPCLQSWDTVPKHSSCKVFS